MHSYQITPISILKKSLRKTFSPNHLEMHSYQTNHLELHSYQITFIEICILTKSIRNVFFTNSLRNVFFTKSLRNAFLSKIFDFKKTERDLRETVLVNIESVYYHWLWILNSDTPARKATGWLLHQAVGGCFSHSLEIAP